VVLHAFGQYGNAVRHRVRISEGERHEESRDLSNQLKRKENALGLSFRSLVAQKTVERNGVAKINENNMLAHLFSVTPMMDWNGTSRKAKR